MEENVALDSSKQKQFVKSVKGIKKLIKKNEKEAETKVAKTYDETTAAEKPAKDGKKKRKRGLVYLSHIPHGFYEHEMTQYFKQFGVVTNARVIRSKRTGASKGFAFVEFREPTVAQIVAETMNNYLMGKRLIKAVYIPPNKQRPAMRKHWNSTHNPASVHRLKMKKIYNADKDQEADLKKARKLLENLTKTKTKLSELGINYDFFTPVDVPPALVNEIDVKKDGAEKESIPKSKKAKGKKEPVDSKVSKKYKEKEQPVVKTKNDQKNKQGKKAENQVMQKDKRKKVIEVESKVVQKAHKEKALTNQKPVAAKNENKKGSQIKEDVTSKKQEKQKKLTVKDVQPLEEFIKVGDDSESNDDSSYEFDSDEFTKTVEDEFNSDASSDDCECEDDEGSNSGDDSEDGESSDDILQFEDSSEEDVPPPKQKQKNKSVQKEAEANVKKNVKQQVDKPHQMKRKALQKTVAPTKKPKFEKQMNKKQLNKQFKKKK